MAGKVLARLHELGFELPPPNKPVGAYTPATVSGNLIFVSGQLTLLDGELKYMGRIGENLTLEDGMAAARLCGLNLISQLNEVLHGKLDKITQVVKLTGYVNCTPEFTEHPKVINGASDLMVQIFGEAGKHARSAIGANSLPLGMAVEIEGIFEFA